MSNDPNNSADGKRRKADPHSIFDEPALAANPDLVDHVAMTETPCPACGYDRQGLRIGDACPECGHDIYESLENNAANRHADERHLHRPGKRGNASKDQSVYREASVAGTSQNVKVQQDTACIGCGYNLRGMAIGDACPECGKAIASAAKNGPTDRDEALHSVHNELAMFPPDAGEGESRQVYERDWSCPKCNYNLRGCVIAAPCPECGDIARQLPPSLEKTSYGKWLKEKIAATSTAKTWGVVLIVMVVGGPWSILGAFFQNSVSAAWLGILVAVFVAPPVEEMMKMAAAAYVVEVKPYLFKNRLQIIMSGIAAGLAFGLLENVYYINVVFPQLEDMGQEITPGLIAFRWIVCTLLHVTCSTIASFGMARIWQKATTELREPRFADGFPLLVTAMVLHGVYNGGTIVFGIVEHVSQQ